MATKVLVFESDAAFAGELRSELSNLGCTTDVVEDGNLGLQKASAEKPDLILLDLIMPGKDGFETLHDLKKDPNLASVPVIAFSNLGQDEDIERTKKLGVADYLIKTNLSVHEMVEKVKEHLKD